jgi:1,2-diacylglycerol 3-alpha-glucosyltransferase
MDDQSPEARMKVALLCSGLGRVHRGHEVFARELFTLLRGDVDMTLLKGGGETALDELVIDHIPRDAPYLDQMHLVVAPKWRAAAQEMEAMRVEGETFAYASLKPLLEGGFDVIHCLEQEVCNVVYAQRHLFRKTPKVLFSNGGAIAARDLPACDFVQEHTQYNLERSARHKAFMIPHGVDLRRFHPGIESDFRKRHGIPSEALVVISVGTICYWHKRMDYVIREVAAVPGAWLVVVGQESADSPAIKTLGRELMDGRIVFSTMPHDQLPQAYAAADVFALGSLFETFGIVYIEAMAMALPVICTDHPNQRAIVKEGVFIDMRRDGALAEVLRTTDRAQRASLGEKGRRVAIAHYDLNALKAQYIERYHAMAAATAELPRYSMRHKVLANLNNAVRKATRLLSRHGG